jgi:phospholipid/cholesterol/gamma-HCH transport system substrate-binding protein
VIRTLRTQLIALVAIALAGSTYIGAHYAHVGSLFGHGGYTVTVHLADSGGIFSGADATYRGVSVGRVTTMTLTATGVDAQVEIEHSARIPADTLVVVADKSAVGEQYLDFQPRRDGGPELHDGSQVARTSTRVPVRTDTLLTNLDGLVSSVSTRDLRTVIDELGTAFAGTGPKLQQIISTSTAFITTAQEKYDVTAQLIRDSTKVLQTQVDSSNDISDFVGNLDLLSKTLRGSDADLRTVLDSGAATADTLREVIAENSTDLGALVDQLVTTNRVVRAHLPGIQGVLVLAPYGLEGAYSILAKDPQSGQYSARFSLSLQPDPGVCTRGTKVRTPFDTSAAAVAGEHAGVGTCPPDRAAVPSIGATTSKTPSTSARAGDTRSSQVVATYDEQSRRLVPSASPSPADIDPSNLGGESWTWMVLGSAVTK